MIEINVDVCTRNAETCPNVEYIIATDIFACAVEEFDPDATARRELLTNLFTACVNGNCFGHDPRLAFDLYRKKLDQRAQE
jgi:hypothetical protein